MLQLLVWNTEVRKKLFKTYVWSVALYGYEAWTIDKAHGEEKQTWIVTTETVMVITLAAIVGQKFCLLAILRLLLS